jgi:D-serine deaminase-like pyridoxal phosphate-dependent protein
MSDLPEVESYRFDSDRLLTPALAIYPDLVVRNIQAILRLLGGDTNRWRPHLKTVKIAVIMRSLLEANVTKAKCATTRELLVACQTGFQDVLIAFPPPARTAERVCEIARAFPAVRVSALLEAPEQIASWTGTPVGVFVDINPGMDRTGIEQGRTSDIVELVQHARRAGLSVRGLHFYDGHATEPDLEERIRSAHKRYDALVGIMRAIERSGIAVPEVITSGTPAIPAALSYKPFENKSKFCQISPGTVVYNDLSSLKQLPAEYGLVPAALIISRVVSHPRSGIVTCDAGHKALSVDSGVPNCAVLGEPAFIPQRPSEEHLPIAIPEGRVPPPLGSLLYLVPKHVCPTVNNANYALLVENGCVSSVADVTARGHESPLVA